MQTLLIDETYSRKFLLLNKQGFLTFFNRAKILEYRTLKHGLEQLVYIQIHILGG